MLRLRAHTHETSATFRFGAPQTESDLSAFSLVLSESLGIRIGGGSHVKNADTRIYLLMAVLASEDQAIRGGVSCTGSFNNVLYGTLTLEYPIGKSSAQLTRSVALLCAPS